MVGVLVQERGDPCGDQTPDNAIYHVKKGNYVGQNFGLITQIGDSQVSLREIVQDSAGDWSERTSTLILQE